MKICFGVLLYCFVYAVYSSYLFHNAKEFFLSKIFVGSHSKAKHHCHKEHGWLAEIENTNSANTFKKMMLADMRNCLSEYY